MDIDLTVKEANGSAMESILTDESLVFGSISDGKGVYQKIENRHY
jgi:hypothetical protein